MIPSTSAQRAAAAGTLIHDGEAWVGNANRRLRSWFDGAVHEIRIDGIGVFSVADEGRRVSLLERADTLDDVALIEAVLGAPLLLALAMRGVFCLHASAARLGDGAVLFLGDSGAGKSTLVRMLRDAGPGMSRLTDDISPLRSATARYELLPQFSQPRLPASEQFAGPGRTAFFPVNSIYNLRRTPRGQPENPVISLRRLGPVESFNQLVGQSVASRLFTGELLRRHTGWIAGMVNTIPVQELTYPSGEEFSGPVREVLAGNSN